LEFLKASWFDSVHSTEATSAWTSGGRLGSLGVYPLKDAGRVYANFCQSIEILGEELNCWTTYYPSGYTQASLAYRVGHIREIPRKGNGDVGRSVFFPDVGAFGPFTDRKHPFTSLMFLSQ
jgi:hypothetical protein